MIKNKLKINQIIICLIVLSVISCTSLAYSVLKLKDRRLIPCLNKSGLCWPHKVCKKDKWYKKPKCHWDEGFMDFNVKEVREKLLDMGFSCTSDRRFR